MLSTLFPGQACKAPTGYCVAVVLAIEWAFESITNVIDPTESSVNQCLSRILRTLPAAADENNGWTVLLLNDTGHKFLYLGNKAGIHLPVGFILPGNVNGISRMTDQKKFH